MISRLEHCLLKLYNDKTDNFYSYLFFQMDRRADKSCPTMGVGIINNRLTLVYNPDFMSTLRDELIVTVLKHEGAHLIGEHLSRGKGAKNKDMTRARMENIAMDCAINQYLNTDHIKEIGGITLESFTEMLTHLPKGTKVEPKLTWEYYYNLLLDEKTHREKNNGDLQELLDALENGEMDDHSSFGQGDALDAAMIGDKIRKAAEDAKKSGAGNLPSEVEELLKVNKTPLVPWRRELRRFVGGNTRASKKTTRSKRNRRYGITFAGYKKDYKARLLVVLDSSGSMCGSRTDKVLSEIYGIYKASPNNQIDIVQCDAEIKNVFTYEGSDEFEIKGRGGTEMSPALEYAELHKYDGVIMLTDGEFFNEDFSKYNKVPSLWIIAENSKYKSPIGTTINID